MKKVLLFLALISILKVNAQTVDVGVGLGVSNYWGDLAPSLALNETHAAGTLFGRLNFNNTWSLVGQLSSFNVSGNDKNFEFNKSRNLNFTSNIRELAGLVEYNFVPFGYGVLDYKVTGYIFGGFSYFQFNPQTTYNGETVTLRDVKTEGVGYNKYSFAIPFGVGVKWIFARNFSLEGNFNIRKTYTDYIDDVSAQYLDYSGGSLRTQQIADRSYEIYGSNIFQKGTKRGSDNYNDWYMTFTASIAYRIPGRIKCPSFF